MVDEDGTIDRCDADLMASGFVAEQSPQQLETAAIGWPEQDASKRDRQAGDVD